MENEASLHRLAASLGLSIGCQPDIQAGEVLSSAAEACLGEFDALTSNAFHWCALQPEGPGKWSWSRADAAVDWAEARGKNLRGHALLWYQMLPNWLQQCDEPRTIERCLREHVRTVVSRYRGRVASWDVVNEVIMIPDGHPDGMRRDFLHKHFDERYIDIAFEEAAAADPGAELVLNEALLVHRDQEPQRVAFLRLVERLLRRGVPLQACGIQGHLYWDDEQPMGPLDPPAIARHLRSLGELGVDTLITELDVFDARFPVSEPERDRLVALAYEGLFTAILGEPSLRGVVFWGLGDERSWFNTYVRRVLPDRIPGGNWRSRPLLFDNQFRPKPAYFAVASTLRNFILGKHGNPEAQAAPVAA
ncbi:MAG: endo-1,4-beta-xylanase [Terrimicrobiaceae bacterium]